MSIFTEKASQNKAIIKISNDLNSDNDKITDRLDINKLKIDVKAFIKVFNIITRLQTKSTATDTVTNIKSLSDKVVSCNLNKLKTLKFIVKSSEKKKDFTLKKKGKKQAHMQEDNLKQKCLLYNRIFV
jgi:hypothetical protein